MAQNKRVERQSNTKLKWQKFQKHENHEKLIANLLYLKNTNVYFYLINIFFCKSESYEENF